MNTSVSRLSTVQAPAVGGVMSPGTAAVSAKAAAEDLLGPRPPAASWMTTPEVTRKAAVAGVDAAQGPDPKRHDHAVYSVAYRGFWAEENGDPFGKAELYVKAGGLPRTPHVKTAD